MFVTIKKLREMNVCTSGEHWFMKAFPAGVEHGELCERLLAENHFDWANWFLSRALSRKGKIRYAIFAAEQVLDIFEKKYPEDKRPRGALQAAKDYLEGKVDKKTVTNAAAHAANAAYAATYAAANAAYAATYAANAATYAANAAYAATYAAYAADEMKTRIIRHGIELLNTQAER